MNVAGFDLVNEEAETAYGSAGSSSHPRSHCGELSTLGLFWLKGQFQYTYTKEIKSQDLLLHVPEMAGVGESAHSVHTELE